MTALEDFHRGVAEVGLLLTLLPDGEDDIPEGPDRAALLQQRSALTNALTRGSTVLLVSHFEGFLRSLAEEYVDAISSGQIEARKIPVALKELHTLPRLSAISQATDPKQRAALLKKIQSYAVLWNDDAKPSPGTLSTEVVARQITSAASHRIDELFILFGSSDAVCDGDIDISSSDSGDIQTLNIRAALRDVIDCRNEIAHGNVDRKPTPSDVKRYTVFLTALGERLARKSLAYLALVLP